MITSRKLFVLVTIVLVTSCITNHESNNKIIFNDSFEKVERNIITVETYLKEISRDTLYSYYLKNNEIYVNHIYLGRINNNSNKKIKETAARELKIDLPIDNIIFLHRNSINYAHYDFLLKSWVFGYNCYLGDDYNEVRLICLKSSPIYGYKNIKILDIKHSLLLIKLL